MGRSLWIAALALACSQPGSDSAAGTDAGPGVDGGAEPAACGRSAAPADGPRRVVVGHPYGDGGSQEKVFEVLELSADGELSRPGIEFEMDRVLSNRITFTPDGLVGIAAHTDGSLGVFRFEDDGSVTVVHERFDGGFYATEVMISVAGDKAWILDSNWRDNGGGIYEVAIGCDGTLTTTGKVVEAQVAHTMRRIPGRDAFFLTADDVLDSPLQQDAHLLNLSAAPTRESSVIAYPDDEAIVTSAAVTRDGKYAVIGDTGFYAPAGNRLAIISLGGEQLSGVSVVDIEDPYAMVPSPFGDSILVVSGFGNDAFVMSYDPDGAEPFQKPAALTFVGAKPQLPGKAVVIDRGPLEGLVLLAENIGVRRLRFEGNGLVTDLGLFALGEEDPVTGEVPLTAVTSAIGVTP